MTAYATPADVLAAAPDLELLAGLLGATDQVPVPGAVLRAAVAGTAPPAGTSDDEIAAAALAVAALTAECQAATDRCDAALADRYTVPLAPVPPLVRRIACDLALAGCVGARPAGPESAYAGYLRRGSDAAKLLGQLQTGALTLGVATPAPVAATASPAWSAPTPVFGADFPAGY